MNRCRHATASAASAAALGTARATPYGDVTVTGNIPSSLPPGAHKLVAVDSDGRRATATITVS